MVQGAGPHRCRRARARPGRACRSGAATGETDTVRDALNAHLRPHPVAVLSAEKRGGRFRRAPLGGAAALSLSHRQPPARSRARARPRLAGAAPARCRGDARRRAAAHRQARLHDVPLDRMPGQVAGEDTRPARRARAAATRCTSPPSARSFLHNQVRSMVGSLVMVGDGKWSADDLAARARSARPRRLRPGRAAGRALFGQGGLLTGRR